MAIEDDAPLQTKTIRVAYTEWGEYHYFASFAVSFGYRAIPTTDAAVYLNKIWADGELWYDFDTGKRRPGVRWYFLPGTEDQMPPDGAELAYRGQMVLWFSNLDLGDNGTIPQFSVEITDGANVTVAEALSLISQRAGYEPDDIHSSASLDEITLLGYVLDNGATLEQVATDLAFLYDFNFTEVGGEIFFQQVYTDGAIQVTTEIIADTLAFLSESSSDAAAIDNIEVGADQSLPRQITANFFNYSDNYQTGTETAFRQYVTASQSDISLSLPIVITSAEMRSRLFDALSRSWDERNGHALRLPPIYMQVDPSDVLSFGLYGNDYVGVVVKATLNGDWSTSLSLMERAAEYHANDVETQPPATPVDVVNPTPSRAVIMDVPDTSADQEEADWLNVRIALGRYSTDGDWNGARLDMAPADTVNAWAPAVVLDQDEEVGIGSLAETPDDYTGELTDLDTSTMLVVELNNFSASHFVDASDAELDAGANLIIVGRQGFWEYVQFKTTNVVGDTIELTDLRRGLYGTDNFVNQHLEADVVVFAEDTTTIQYSVADYRANQQFAYRVVSAFELPEDSVQGLWSPQGNSRRPWTPNEARVYRETDGDLTFQWNEDTDRFTLEPDHVFSLDIFNDDWSLLLRRVQPIVGTTYLYTTDKQAADGTELLTTFNFLVYQMNASHVGRGFPSGGAIEEIEHGVLEGRVGPLVGPYGEVETPGALEGRVGPLVGPRGDVHDPYVGYLSGTVGPLRGPLGELDGEGLHGTVGPLNGPYGTITTVAGLEGGVGPIRGPYGPLYDAGSAPYMLWRVSVATRGTDSTHSVSLPSVNVGDVILVKVTVYGDLALGSYGTWHQIGTVDDQESGAVNMKQGLYYLVKGVDTIPASISAFGLDFTTPHKGYLVEAQAFRNLDPANPIVTHAFAHSNSSTNSHVSPSVTPAEVGDLLAFFATGQEGNRSYTVGAGLTDAGTKNFTNSGTISYLPATTGMSSVLALMVAANDLASGAKTQTYSVSKPYMSAAVALRTNNRPKGRVGPVKGPKGTLGSSYNWNDANTVVLIQGQVSPTPVINEANGLGSISAVGSPVCDTDGWLNYEGNASSTNYHKFAPGSSTLLTPGTNWTIEWYEKANNALTNRGQLSHGAAANSRYAPFNASGSNMTWFHNAVALNTCTVNRNDGVAHHIAWTKQGNTYRMFVDGILDSTVTDATAWANSSTDLTIGTDDASAIPRRWQGRLDRIRISNICRYTANFTPPARR